MHFCTFLLVIFRLVRLACSDGILLIGVCGFQGAIWMALGSINEVTIVTAYTLIDIHLVDSELSTINRYNPRSFLTPEFFFSSA